VTKSLAPALVALAASIAIAACGTQEGGTPAAGTAPTVPVAPPTRKTDPGKSCDAQGINARQLRAGACTDRGLRWVVANYGGVVPLRTLAVGIVGVTPSGGYRGGSGVLKPRKGAFLVVKLQVQNLDRVPHRWAYGQTMLGVGAHNYLEREDIERTVHPEPLAKANGGRLGPGDAARGDVVFDITKADFADLSRRGRFFIWNFGDKASQRVALRTGQLGQVRLYAIERSAAAQQQQQQQQKGR